MQLFQNSYTHKQRRIQSKLNFAGQNHHHSSTLEAARQYALTHNKDSRAHPALIDTTLMGAHENQPKVAAAVQ